MAETILKKMENRLRILPKGTVIIPSDFTRLANDNTIRQYLYQLTRQGKLIALGNGMYKKPNFNELLQMEIPVAPDQWIKAYARKKNWQIYPSKNLALNALGLSTQVPTVYTYKSNGANAKVQLANHLILFEKVLPKNVSEHQMSNIVIEAIDYLGKERISSGDLQNIKDKLSRKEYEQLKDDSSRATVWIREEIRKMEKM